MEKCNGTGEEANVSSCVEEEERKRETLLTQEEAAMSPEGDGQVQEYSFSAKENSMLERLSKNAKVIVKSQQRDEPDMSATEKLKALKAQYSAFPIQFLAKLGGFMQAEDCVCFEKLKLDGNYEAMFYLKEMEKCNNKDFYEKRLKNRRYEALKKLVETTDYFSEEEMQRRNPLLFDQLIGKYHTEEERAAFLQQSWKSTSGSGTTSMPLTDMFLAHLERTPEGISCRRMAQETQQDEEDAADAEYDSENEDVDMESPGPSRKPGKSPRRRPTVNDESEREEIDDDEKELLKEEFFTTMYRNFLNGKDEDFDYSTVDDNPEYDCGENLDNDEEEKYFDDEEPCEISEPNSDLDDQFKPPVRSSDIESKIEKLSVNQNPDKTEPEQTTIVDEDEDELDAYMREIEKQLRT